MLRSITASAVLVIACTGSAADPPSAPAVPAQEAAPLLTVTVVPLGSVDAALSEQVAESLRRRFNLRVEVRSAQALPQSAWYAPRNRWRAEKLLDYLDAVETSKAWRVTGITEAPISTTKGSRYDWGIAGLGTLGGRTNVLTAYLFRAHKKKDPAAYRRYMENLVLHEFGHTLGLDHCPLERCIMADAKGNALRAARASINEFCPRCTRLLREHLRDPAERGLWSAAERAIIDRLP